MKRGLLNFLAGAAVCAALPLAAVEQVDVLIAYDASAVAWLAESGSGTVESFAAEQVTRWNAVLANTDLTDSFVFRLAGVVSIDEDASSLAMDDIIMNRLVDTLGQVVATGEWKKITDAREEKKADIVSLLVRQGTTGVVGFGYSLPALVSAAEAYAYNVCSIESAVECYTQLHEIGHNMGCGHPYELNGEPLDHLFPYAAGSYLTGTHGNYFTVMGYNYDGYGNRYEPYPAFSSASHTMPDGLPLGDADHDNTRVLRETCALVAGYRKAGNKPPPVIVDDPGKDEQPSKTPVVTENGFSPAKAGTMFAVCRNARGEAVGILQLKYGKVSRAGKSKVSGSLTRFDDGKKKSIKSQSVDVGGNPTVVCDGGSLTLSASGVTGTAFGLQVAGGTVGGLVSKEAVFAMDGNGFAQWNDLGFEPQTRFLPTGETVQMNGAKWNCNGAGSVKFAKDKTTGEKTWVLNNGKDQPSKRNWSGLKLSYAPKTGLFKGSCTFYTLVNDKMKKVKGKIAGILVDGIGEGFVIVKGYPPVLVTIR